MQQYTTILTEDKFTPSELRVHKGIPVVITNNTNRYCYLDCCEEHLAPGDKANVIFFESTEVTDLQNIFLLLRVTVEAQEPPSTPTPNNTLVLKQSSSMLSYMHAQRIKLKLSKSVSLNGQHSQFSSANYTSITFRTKTKQLSMPLLNTTTLRL
jgi:hypothetical protein